jgi:hypothetical protein
MLFPLQRLLFEHFGTSMRLPMSDTIAAVICSLKDCFVSSGFKGAGWVISTSVAEAKNCPSPGLSSEP